MSIYRILCLCLPLCVLASSMPVSADAAIVLETKDNTLTLTVCLSGGSSENGRLNTFVGNELSYRAVVSNASSSVVRLPESACRLDARLTMSFPKGTVITARSPGFGVRELPPRQSIEFTGRQVILYPETKCWLAEFENRGTESRFRVEKHIPDGPQTNGARASVVMPDVEDRPIKDVWTGKLSVQTEINVQDLLEPRLQSLYRASMTKVLQSEGYEVSPTNYVSYLEGRMAQVGVRNVNVTLQNETFDLVRRVARDGNKFSAAWLWGCFGITKKNSPIHALCMIELYDLLNHGIGVEHLDKFRDVALRSSQTEAVATRLYAMDAISMILPAKSNIVCRASGNDFVSEVSPKTRQACREALEQLLTESLDDIRLRAAWILGVPGQGPRPNASRKYVRPPSPSGNADPFEGAPDFRASP